MNLIVGLVAISIIPCLSIPPEGNDFYLKDESLMNIHLHYLYNNETIYFNTYTNFRQGWAVVNW